MNYKWLENAAIEQPENIALKFQDESLNYRQLYMKAHELATHLQALKVKRVGLYIDNSLDASILIHALMLSGTEMVMLNTRLTVHELKLQLEEVSVSTVLSTIHLDIPEFKVLSFEEIYDLPAETFMLNDQQLTIFYQLCLRQEQQDVQKLLGKHMVIIMLPISTVRSF